METDRQHDDADATSVTGPEGPPPDEGKAYDRELTEQDEANIPPESEVDPQG